MELYGIFGRSKVMEIMCRRREFEYILNSPLSTPSDYLKAIAYEKEIEQHRKINKRKTKFMKKL